MLCASINAINIKKEITDLLRLASLEQRNSFIDFPSSGLNEVIKNAALNEKISLKEGVYFFTKGPGYETPAEIKMLARLGNDAVGMSTVHEAIYAKITGMEVSIISVITNYAAGISPVKLTHQEVTTTANRARESFTRLLKKTISS